LRREPLQNSQCKCRAANAAAGKAERPVTGLVQTAVEAGTVSRLWIINFLTSQGIAFFPQDVLNGQWSVGHYETPQFLDSKGKTDIYREQPAKNTTKRVKSVCDFQA
jgi:hypothetical protein